MTEEDLKYWYEERSAILHFDGGLPKEKAEMLYMPPNADGK